VNGQDAVKPGNNRRVTEFRHRVRHPTPDGVS
jgi:hypothetical protein